LPEHVAAVVDLTAVFVTKLLGGVRMSRTPPRVFLIALPMMLRRLLSTSTPAPAAIALAVGVWAHPVMGQESRAIGQATVLRSMSSNHVALVPTLRAVTVSSRRLTTLLVSQTPAPQCVCTMSFAMVTISLVDAAGKPVSDARVRVRRVTTNTTRDVAEELPGMYTIADDMLRDSLRADGEAFEVSVRWKNRTRRVTVLVGTKDPTSQTAPGTRAATRPDCRCHVRRLSGPERIVLR